MKYQIKCADPEQRSMFYSDCDPALRNACVGHLRMDFGSDNEFWNTWWGNRDDLNDSAFKAELNDVVNELRKDGLLKNRSEMRRYCATHQNLNNTLLVYIRLLLGAVWCDTAYQNIILQRGQIATTLPKIAQENGITERQARTILDRLKSTGKATVKTTSKFSIITLIDYDCALGNDSQLDSHLTGERQTARQSNVRPTLYNTELQNNREQSTRANDFNEVKQLFNSICVSLPPLEYDPTAQQAHLVEQARINLRDSSFEEFFKRVEKSDFLCGRCGKFKATFEWILKPENMQKIRSGKYDQSYKQAATPTNVLTANPWENMTDEEVAELAAHFYD